MAKGRADDMDMVDESPAKGPPAIATMSPPKATPAAPQVVAAPPKTAADDAFPWGFLVKHPSFGALRVRKDEASNEAEAIEVYRKTKCPHMKTAQLTDTGMRISVLKFVPAETERGK